MSTPKRSVPSPPIRTGIATKATASVATLPPMFTIVLRASRRPLESLAREDPPSSAAGA
ncbi:MAG: hypothetical protein WKF31_03115 [Thermoleophilaceae bacterium]